MTELNRTTVTDPAGKGDQVIWPALPAEADEATGNTPGDPSVAGLLDHLGDLPELPVALHGEVYAGLHDGLLAALNEDVAGSAGAQSTPGTATETEDATHEQA